MSGYNQSLPSQFHQLLPQGIVSAEDKTIKTSLLKVFKNTLAFENTVYQIRNISSLELADLTVTITRSAPGWYWIIVIAGILTIPIFIGFFILIVAVWLFWQHNQNKTKTNERYGLKIALNSGEYMILTSASKEFVLRIIVTLYNVMNSEDPQAVAFNFETLKIEDRSTTVGEIYGSTVVSGQVAGNVVNNV